MEVMCRSSNRAGVMVLRGISSRSVRRFTPYSNLTCDQKRLLRTQNLTSPRNSKAGAAPSHRIQQRAAPNPTAPGRKHRRSVTEISLHTIRPSSPSSPPTSLALLIHCQRLSTSQRLYHSKRHSKPADKSQEDSGLSETNKKPSIMPSGTHPPLQLINILPFQALALHPPIASEHLRSSRKRTLHCPARGVRDDFVSLPLHQQRCRSIRR